MPAGLFGLTISNLGLQIEFVQLMSETNSWPFTKYKKNVLLAYLKCWNFENIFQLLLTVITQFPLMGPKSWDTSHVELAGAGVGLGGAAVTGMVPDPSQADGATTKYN